MPEQSIIIKFKSTGSEALTRAIRNLTKAERELRGETNKLRKNGGLLDTSFGRNRKSASLLSNAFATMRSKLLLVNFAMGLGITQVIRFAQEATRVKNMEIAFNSLSGGTDNARVAMSKLRDATNNTMSQFDLFQQANNAMILGVTKNSDEMAEMFDMAQRLGRALGRDTASSVESLITGIGRQSRLMLDNIGIIVKSDDAYKSYAAELGVTVDKLTDAQKKQAFMNATLESAREKLKSLPEETLSTQDKFDQLVASSSNLAIVIGNRLSPVLGDTSSFLTTMTDKLASLVEITDLERIRDLDKVVNSLNTQLKQTFEFKQITKLRKELKDLDPEKDGGRIAEVEKAIAKFQNRIKLMEESKLLDKFNKEIDTLNNSLNNMVAIENPPFLVNLSEMNPDMVVEMNKSIDEAVKSGNIKAFNAALDKVMQPVPKNENSIDKAVKLVTEEAKLAQMGIDAISSSLASAAVNGKHMGMAVEKALKQIAAQIAAKASIFALFSILSGGTGAGALRFALGLQTAHTGGLIKDNKVQKFATGGVVQGEDNVPILAQNGEFVMSRSAVESVGIETMNRINQTGSAGVTVNVSGNVMSQDFVEGELAERIKEAVRKGSNFGMS